MNCYISINYERKSKINAIIKSIRCNYFLRKSENKKYTNQQNLFEFDLVG